MKKTIKKKDHERLDDANIERVIELLNAEKPITKKAACEILNISNNTTRLNKIIEDYKERKERRKRNFAKNRGRPLDPLEKKNIINWYLQGYNITDLSEMLYRPPTRIKDVLDEVGVPERARGDDAHRATLLPTQAVRDSFNVGEYVWSARYHSVAEIMKDRGKTRDGLSNAYQIYVYEKTEHRGRGGFYADQRAEDLGSLSHLSEYIDAEKMTF